MIKLERAFHPLCLSPDEVKRLTAEYKATKASVWNFDALKEALLATSQSKCAYCECDLTKESNYMEVEHFRDKGTYSDDVVEWSNLLPSCKRCNGAKGTHNVVANPIVNPYEHDPRDHFNFRLYRIRSKTSIGAESIDALDLNNSERAVTVRFEIGEGVHETLQQATDILEAYIGKQATRTKNRLLGVVKGVLKECQPSSEYAATVASIVHSDVIYAHIANELRRLGLWDTELQSLDTTSKEIAFDLI